MAGLIRRRVVGAALSRGVFGESQFWMGVAVILGVRWVVRRLAGDGAVTLFSDELRPGESLLIGPAENDG